MKPYLFTYYDICQILDVIPKTYSSFQNIQINKVWYYINESDENTLFVHYQKSQSDLKLIDQALEKGCLVITSMDIANYPKDAKIIQVNSVLEAIQKLAKFNRSRFKGKLISVTGSVGKSSVKNLTSQVLSAFGSTFSILKNENGTMGVNTLLASIHPDTNFGILEVSASGPNSIQQRSKPIQANIGIVTNAAYNHLIKYSNTNELRKEKLALLDSLSGEKIAIVSRKLFDEDYENENLLAKKELGRLCIVGEHPDDDIQLVSYQLSATNSTSKVKINNKTHDLFLPVPGKHFIETAMFSLAVADVLNLDINQALLKCSTFIPPSRRNERFKVSLTDDKTIEVIDDAFNASPISVNALLELLSIRKNVKRKVLILGDMLELGDEEATKLFHLELGTPILEAGIDCLITVGPSTKRIADILNSKITTYSYENTDNACDNIQSLINDGDLVAVKGSGAMKLSTIVAKLKGNKSQFELAKDWTIESHN